MQQIYRRHRVPGIPGLQQHRRHLSQPKILLLHLMVSLHQPRTSPLLLNMIVDRTFIYFSALDTFYFQFMFLVQFLCSVI